MSKKYIGIDVGKLGFVAVIDNGEYRLSERQNKSLVTLGQQFNDAPKEVQSYIVDKLLQHAGDLLSEYSEKTSMPINIASEMGDISTDREIWRDITIAGIENCYQVSNFGRVRNIRKNIRDGGRILRIKENPKVGYIYLTVKSNGAAKHFRVHRLVAEAFIPNPNGYAEVNHIDENKLNNRFDNLEWCSKEDNRGYGTRQERMLNTRRVRDLQNKGISIVGIDPLSKEVRVRFESLREAHSNGFRRAPISFRIKNNSKSLYKGLIWEKVG